MFTIHSYRNTHYKTQLHNYEYSYLFINKKKIVYLYLKFCTTNQQSAISNADEQMQALSASISVSRY